MSYGRMERLTGEVSGACPLPIPKWFELVSRRQKSDTQMGRSCGTLQWQDANVKVFQLAEGADKVQFILDGLRTVCDQLETCPGEKKNKGMWSVSVLTLGGNTQVQPKIWTFSCKQNKPAPSY